jgi:hypothetical protein
MDSILIAFVLAIQAGNGTEPKPVPLLNICDVISNDPTKLNGKVIKVRGLLGGTDEGIWLVGECKTHLVTKGLTWGNDLSVYVDESDEAVARSWEKLGQQLRQLHADTRRDRVWVTNIGRLETRASMDDEVVKTEHGLVRVGFGHMSGSPAEINVISVEDVKLERQPVHKPPE